MKSTQISLVCGVIVLALCSGCSENHDPLGTSDALVWQVKKSGSADTVAAPSATPPSQAQTVTAGSGPGYKASSSANGSVEVASAKRLVWSEKSVVAYQREPETPLNTDAETLVSLAARRLNAAKIDKRPALLVGNIVGGAETGSIAGTLGYTPPDWKEDLKAAVEASNQAIELINKETEPQVKIELEKTKVSALSIRAEALRIIASRSSTNQVNEAETATAEYIAAETDPGKRKKAATDLAGMYYSVRDLSKARSSYENLLTQNPNDKLALSRLSTILIDTAKAEEASGDKSKAEADRQLATAYLNRLLQLKSQEPDITASADAPVEGTEGPDLRPRSGIELKMEIPVKAKVVTNPTQAKPPTAAKKP